MTGTEVVKVEVCQVLVGRMEAGEVLLGMVEVGEVLPVGKVESGEVLVGKKMLSRGELSWTGRPTWRGQPSLLRGLLNQVRGILTQVRGKIGQDSERSSFSVRAVPLLSFCCSMQCLPSWICTFSHIFVQIYSE